MDDQHHPQWSFVRKWNVRICHCAQCDAPRSTPYPIGFAPQGPPPLPYSQSPYRIDPNEYKWVTNTTTRLDTTNVK